MIAPRRPTGTVGVQLTVQTGPCIMVSTDATRKGPHVMLNPVVLLPIPAALLLLALAIYAALRYTQDAVTGTPEWLAASAPQPRHRLASNAAAYRPRPWDAAAEPAPKPKKKTPRKIKAFDPLDHSIPLAEVERHTEPIDPMLLLSAQLEATHKRDGNTLRASTGEMAAVA
jgi:hypothetical protein